MNYLSLFSGIGGFELGIKKALQGKNAVCVGYSEIDPHAIKTYTTHFPKHKNFGDITKIQAKKLPDFDLLVGGFPCQSFSIAGKRKGFADTRGTLFFDIARILRAKKPRLFFLENVKGLLSHDQGRTFKTIIATLASVGYRVEWQVCNSKNFGVAQHRERVCIVGYHGTKRAPKVFPIEGTNPKTDSTDKGQTRSGIRYVYDGGYINRKVYDLGGISPALLTTSNDIPLVAITNGTTREFKWNKEHAPALCAHDSKNPKLVGYECLKCNEENRSAHLLYCRIRKLTPIECERLQGFPDGWTEGISDSQRYKCLGNAVTTKLITAIIRKMRAL